MPTACGGVHAAHPGTQSEADDRQGTVFIGMEAVVKDLLETHCNGQLVAHEPRPKAGISRGAGRNGDHVAAFEAPAPAQLGQRMTSQVILFADEWQAAKIVRGLDRARIDVVCRQKRSVGGHRLGHLAEKGKGRLRGVSARCSF